MYELESENSFFFPSDETFFKIRALGDRDARTHSTDARAKTRTTLSYSRFSPRAPRLSPRERSRAFSLRGERASTGCLIHAFARFP